VRRSTDPQVALSPTAQAVDTFVRPAQPRNDTRLGQLADALNTLNPALQNYIKVSDERLMEEQMAQIEFYTEQFRRDREAGAVTAAQVKEVFPELVPTVAARIAQSIASRDAKSFAQERAQAILEDDSIRLDSAARRAAMEQFRQEAMEMIGDNPFYGSAFLSQFDKTFNEFETAWMRETAAYHEQVQMEEFSNLAAEALATGGDLLALDAQWKEGSSLNNIQRNQAVVQAAINLAAGSMDPSILDRVPDRFLNAESKAQFLQTQQAIMRAEHSMWSQRKERAEYARTLAIRNAQASVLQRMSAGERVNPLEFVNMPEVAAFVESWNNKPLLDPIGSKSAAQRLEHGILVSALTGDPQAAFSNDPDAQAFFANRSVTRDALAEHIASRNDLNPQEAVQLLDRLDILSDGQNLMQHPSVQNQRQVLNRHLSVLENSLAQDLGGFMEGISLTADAELMYHDHIISSVMDHLQENGSLPPSHMMSRFAREALEETRNFISEEARIMTGAVQLRPQGQQQPQPQPSTTPTTDQPLSGVTVTINGREIPLEEYEQMFSGSSSDPVEEEPPLVQPRRPSPSSGLMVGDDGTVRRIN
jgi:hypothetical protein